MNELPLAKTLTCIQCPRGCHLSLELAAGPRVVRVTGNGCELGPIWARQEVEDPVRTLTTSVRVEGGVEELVSVRTEQAIPRRLWGEAMSAVRALRLQAPVEAGQVLSSDLAGTSVALISTKGVLKSPQTGTS